MVRALITENEGLRIKLDELEKEKAEGVEIIEIHDHRAEPDSYFTPF